MARLWLLTKAALSALWQASRSARAQHSSQTQRSSLRCGRTTLLVACADSALTAAGQRRMGPFLLGPPLALALALGLGLGWRCVRSFGHAESHLDAG